MYYILYEGLKIESNEPVYCISTVHLHNTFLLTKVMIKNVQTKLVKIVHGVDRNCASFIKIYL